jgi:hypothetical protein
LGGPADAAPPGRRPRRRGCGSSARRPPPARSARPPLREGRTVKRGLVTFTVVNSRPKRRRQVSTALRDHNSDAVRAQPRARLSLDHSHACADAPMRGGSRRLRVDHRPRGELAACEASWLHGGRRTSETGRAVQRRRGRPLSTRWAAECRRPKAMPLHAVIRKIKIKMPLREEGRGGRTGVGVVRGKVLRNHGHEGTVHGLRVDRLVVRPAAHAPRPRSRADTRRCTPRTRTASPGRHVHVGRKNGTNASKITV